MYALTPPTDRLVFPLENGTPNMLSTFFCGRKATQKHIMWHRSFFSGSVIFYVLNEQF